MNNMMASGGGAATGALTGAASGAMIGSVVPGIGTAVGAIAGGLLGAAGGFMSSQGGGSGGGGGRDKKYMKAAKKTADQAQRNTQAVIDKLRADQEAANAAYRAAAAGYSNEFMGRINSAIGAAPDYWTTVNQAVQGKDVVRNEFDTRAKTLAEDSANQALNWNEANQSRMIAFSQALQKANEQSAMDGAFFANPSLKGLIGQLGRNAINDARGIISAEDAATLARNAAQTSSGAGTGFGSDLNRNLSLRDFGIAQFARKDAAVKNTALLQDQIVNPILTGTKVNSFDVFKSMGLNTAQVLDTNRQTMTNSAQMGIDRWDDMLRAGGIALGTRSEADKYDYGQKMGMQGNIYSGTSNTYNNIASLGSRMWETWGNQRLGITSQGWANDQANRAQTAENNAALQRAGIETAGTMAGSLFSEFLKNQPKTNLANTSTQSTWSPGANKVFDESLGSGGSIGWLPKGAIG